MRMHDTWLVAVVLAVAVALVSQPRPSLSPDGQWIAFLRGDDENYDPSRGWLRDQVWVMSINGGSPQPVSGMTAGIVWTPPVWASDSRSLLFAQGGRW
jgi:Tol biopolymer transport system component